MTIPKETEAANTAASWKLNHILNNLTVGTKLYRLGKLYRVLKVITLTNGNKDNSTKTTTPLSNLF